ncbi:MAG: hypothetical protein JJE39_15340, partial [Vicinamibacteria bacterium]|nr:hypothetical protein [Vicinamibacteria bacterium]
FAAVALANAEAPKFKPELRATVFAEVARAAAIEKAYPTSVSVWIEALNRNTQRDWLKEAAWAARRSGKPEVLVSFFEKQQERSPRDVRWAVATRELRVATDNLAGGIEMARIAASVRPERQQLWDEAVELMERDQRFVEAADFLDGWNVQRPADPTVAGKRSALYIRGHDVTKALAVEQAALAAFEETDPEPLEMESRRADAARRLWRNGEPQLAWRLLSPMGKPTDIEAATGLSVEEQFQLAVLNHAFMPLLVAGADDEERVSVAANVLGQYGRLENREQVLLWLMEKLFPSARVDDVFLNQWWTFIQNARLEPALRFRVAQRFARQLTGPWTALMPADFLDDVSDLVVATAPKSGGGETELRLRAPDLDALWTAHLVRFDRANELAAFLRPRFASLIGRVRGTAVINQEGKREPWTAWLDPSPAMETFARGLRSKPDLVQELSDVFEDRRLWTRFSVVAARGWETTPLLAELRPLSRATWLSFRERPFVPASPVVVTAPPVLEDPVLSVRRATLNETSVSLGQFLGDTSTPGAGGLSPLAQRLLGPSVLGDILGDDQKFTWPMFKPRTNVMGEVIETGDDRLAGRGIDALRFPGALWGERPGLAWYALQTYARYRANDPSAIEVPAEWPEAGAGAERGLLTARLALALQGPAAALAQIDRFGLRTSDPELLRFRLKLLVDAGRTAEATAALQRRLTIDQRTMSEDGLRTFAMMAEDLGLPSPLSMFDPEKPVLPELLAAIYDSQGVEAGRRFTTDDRVGFRAALASRWSEKAGALKAPELRVWLNELWANEAAPLPVAGLHRLGDFWPVASAWAATVPGNDRARVIEAIGALPNTSLVDAFPERVGDSRARLLLSIRIRLARGEDDLATSLFRTALAATGDPTPLNLGVIAPELEHAEEEGFSGDEATVGYGEGNDEWTPPPNPNVLAVRALRAPFVAAKRSGLIQNDVVTWLEDQIENDPGGLDFWGFRFEVGSASERAGIAEKLRRAYRRGDIPAYRQSEIVTLLVNQAKELAAPWIQEAQPFWPSFLAVQKHAGWLHDVGMNREAALYLVEARSKALFQRAEEIQAFDIWRRNIDPTGGGPEVWKAALRFWRDDPESLAERLETRLKDHSLDILSARAALRRPTALAPQVTFLAIRALRDVQDVDFINVYADETLLRLRAARSLLTEPRAARTIGGALAPEWLAQELSRRRFKGSDVNAVLADLARLAAAGSDSQTLGGALDLLADRHWEGARDLRGELAKAIVDPPVISHRVVAGRPLLYRPRDLTFGLVSQIVQSDLSRRAQDPQPTRPEGPR